MTCHRSKVTVLGARCSRCFARFGRIGSRCLRRVRRYLRFWARVPGLPRFLTLSTCGVLKRGKKMIRCNASHAGTLALAARLGALTRRCTAVPPLRLSQRT